MTTFVSRFQGASFYNRKRAKSWLTALSTAALLSVSASAVKADTAGDYPVGGGTILQLFSAGGLFNNDGTATTNPTAVDLRSAIYAYIVNDYIGFVQGVSGSYTVNFGANTSVTYNIPGRFSIGNRKGSLRTALDDNKALTGFSNAQTSINQQIIWPLAADGVLASAFYYDYAGFTTAVVDGTPRNLGYNASEIVSQPTYVDGHLETTYDAGNNVRVRQLIRLYRSTTRFEYTVTNTDAVAHTLRLRLVLNTRDSIDFRNLNSSTYRSDGLFFVDPRLGRTARPQLYTGGTIPNQIDVLQYRVLLDQGAGITQGFQRV